MALKSVFIPDKKKIGWTVAVFIGIFVLDVFLTIGMRDGSVGFGFPFPYMVTGGMPYSSFGDNGGRPFSLLPFLLDLVLLYAVVAVILAYFKNQKK